MLASIVIDNYNYARFLRDAIESALAQTYADLEVIVVDDGSTDESREVIAGYGAHVRSVFKPNGGQASAFNAGFAASRGDVVLFLDADDMVLPAALAEAVALFRRAELTKVHWPMWVVTERGERTGKMIPRGTLPEGDLGAAVLAGGPTSSLSAPTSGNAWSRAFLTEVMPVPEHVPYYRKCADEFLYTLAPVFGRVGRLADPHGLYRVHGANSYSSLSFEEKLRLELDGHAQQCPALADVLSRHGIDVDLAAWRRASWFHRLQASRVDLARILPSNAAFLLVDDATWDARAMFAGSRAWPFPEQGGEYAGPPADDDVAIRELERMRRMGARFIVFAWPAFWWLEHYAAFLGYLRETFHAMLENERLLVFDLSPRSAIPR